MTSAEKIYDQIKEIWGKEGFVPSDDDVKVTKKLRAELAATGSTKYNDKVNALLKQGVINKNVSVIREKYEEDFEIDEDRVRNLHELGYYDFDLELDGMRNHMRRVRLAKQENEWRKHHFTRETEAVRYRHPVVGSIFCKKTKDGWRVGKLASYEFVSAEDNVTSYGDIYVSTYDDITDTAEGQKALQKWLDATKNWTK